MELKQAFEIIAKEENEAVLHIDHICSDPGAHDLDHCALGVDQVYTLDDANADTPAALRMRLLS